jgi:large subunit ribosomal protein L5
MARLKDRYFKEIVPELMKRFGYRNIMAVPRLSKIVVNMGVGRAIENSARLDEAMNELGLITGQKPVVRKAKKSVAAFKLREGNPIGCKVTLRRDRMYEFLDRLVNVAMPRIRDFRGLRDDAFDGTGNYSLGIIEQTVFPEVNVDKVEFVQGMDVTLVTTAKTDEECRELLTLFGLPFAGRS